MAARFLEARGMVLLGRNVAVGRGELDLLMTDGSLRVAVEVRTRFGGGDPIDAVDSDKRRRVRALAGRVGATRVDYVGVGVAQDCVDIHWVPG